MNGSQIFTQISSKRFSLALISRLLKEMVHNKQNSKLCFPNMKIMSLRNGGDSVILRTRCLPKKGANGLIACCVSNKIMFINILKTVYIMLGSRQQLMRANQMTLYMENELIKMQTIKTTWCNYR